HDARDRVDARRAEHGLKRSRGTQYEVGDERRDHDPDRHEDVAEQHVAAPERRGQTDDDGDRAGAAQARHRERRERDVFLLERLALLLARDRLGLREEHSEADVAHDQAARDPQARDRDPEEAHDEAARDEERDQDQRHVDARAARLRDALAFGEARGDREQDAYRRQRIDDRQQREHGAEDVAPAFDDEVHALTILGMEPSVSAYGSGRAAGTAAVVSRDTQTS